LTVKRKYLSKEDADAFYNLLLKMNKREELSPDEKLHFRYVKDNVKRAAIRGLKDEGSIYCL
jgi:hypothetical protein